MTHSRGFSLIELLCVVGIIAILSAVLAPVMTAARNTAQASQCQSNLKQIAKAFEMYTSDYAGCYPCVADNPGTETDESDPLLWTGRHWRWPMKKYLVFGGAYNPSDPNGANQMTGINHTVLACPADPTSAEQYDKTSYGYSFAFYHRPDQMTGMTKANTFTKSESDKTLRPKVVNTTMVRYPTKKVLVAEWLSAHSDVKVNWWSWGGERNYLFADGHVVYLSAKKIHPSVDNLPDINLTTGGVGGKDID